MSHPCGGAPPQREERWPCAASYGSEVAALGGFSSLLVAVHFPSSILVAAYFLGYFVIKPHIIRCFWFIFLACCMLRCHIFIDGQHMGVFCPNRIEVILLIICRFCCGFAPTHFRLKKKLENFFLFLVSKTLFKNKELKINHLRARLSEILFSVFNKELYIKYFEKNVFLVLKKRRKKIETVTKHIYIYIADNFYVLRLAIFLFDYVISTNNLY